MKGMEKSKTTVSRPLVGFLTIGLFSVTLFLSIWPGALPGAAGATVGGATARVGIVMAALWLALPSRNRRLALPSGNRPPARSNVSFTSVVPLVLAGLALFRRVPFRILLPLAGILLVAGLVLRPRPLQRPERRVD
jgi:hypothetical protein